MAGRPEDLLISAVPVPPVCIRPSVEMDAGAGSNEDDITMRLANIVETNATLRQDLAAGAPASNLMEHWDYLQFLCATVINSDLPGLSAMYQTGGAKPTRGLVQRLKGKQGRFRGNLSGKRVDFSGRTVISPDPNLRVSEVCVPRLMALTLTYPERVTAHNMEKLKQRVLAGASHWPGASFVIFPNGDKVFLRFGDRRRIASELKIGDIVERHLEGGVEGLLEGLVEGLVEGMVEGLVEGWLGRRKGERPLRARRVRCTPRSTIRSHVRFGHMHSSRCHASRGAFSSISTAQPCPSDQWIPYPARCTKNQPHIRTFPRSRYPSP